MTPDQKICKNCRFAKHAGYKWIICGKKNEWKPETESCDRFRKIPCGECPLNGMNACDPGCGYLRYK